MFLLQTGSDAPEFTLKFTLNLPSAVPFKCKRYSPQAAKCVTHSEQHRGYREETESLDRRRREDWNEKLSRHATFTAGIPEKIGGPNEYADQRQPPKNGEQAG